MPERKLGEANIWFGPGEKIGETFKRAANSSTRLVLAVLPKSDAITCFLKRSLDVQQTQQWSF